jgi:hypothetical protein
MINIFENKCIEEGCYKSPCYNLPNLKKRLYCTDHKKDGMINIVSKICEFEGCTIQAKYNNPGEKTVRFCVTHKDGQMIHQNITYCKEEGCKTSPTFNFPGNPSKYCDKHKKEGMINVLDRRCKECDTIASYNFPNMKKDYCAKHKKIGMTNIYGKICKSSFCEINLKNDKYKGYCLHCFIHLFPDEKISRNYCTKERSVTTFIKNIFPNYDWIFNKTIPDGCSKRRPDIYLDLGSHVLIVEIDENQHIDYGCSCETKRLMELSQDILYRPLICIRFNPDSYQDHKNITIKSPWTYTKTGLVNISSKNELLWNNRLEILKNTIEYWIKNNSDKTIEIIHLFYM